MSSTHTLTVPGHQVEKFLGSGARSTIWQIRECHTGKSFALKRVIKRHSSDARFLAQAANEYEVANRFDHPTIRKIYRLHRVKHWLSVREVHLFMELCPGQTVQDERPESPTQTLRIFAQVAEALQHINSRGFVHADMKPNNIVVNPEDGSVKIIDLGQSCPIGTVKQRIQGTPDFIAPEQVRRLPLDGRTDVFNFGATLYWALTGRAIPTVLPKKNATSLKADSAATPPEQLNEQVSAALNKFVLDCIEPIPSRRPRAMTDVAARVALLLASRTDPAKMSSGPPSWQV